MERIGWRHGWRQVRPGEWALLPALLACLPLSALLPAPWSREGGVLETLQVLVLLGGAALALRVYLRSRRDEHTGQTGQAGQAGRTGQTEATRSGMLALCAAPVWILLAARELSWGRVWLPHPDAHPGAAMALTADVIVWLQPFARPGAMLLLAWLAFCAWHYRLDMPLRAALGRRVPWLCLLVALGAAMGSTCAEGHLSCSTGLAPGHAEMFEELVELCAYLALCLLQDAVLGAAAVTSRAARAAWATQASPAEAPPLRIDPGVREPGQP